MIIRPMVVDDLYRGYLTVLESLSPVELRLPEAVQIFQLLPPEINIFVVVDEDNRSTVVGTITVLLEKKFIHRGGVVGHIEDVAVHHDYQKEGVGSKLVNHAIEFCKSNGCYKIILDCRETLCSYYERFGFRKNETGMRLDLACNELSDKR